MTKQIKRSLKDLLNLKKVKQGETAFDRSERVLGYLYLFFLLIHIILFVKDATDPSVPLLGLFQLSMIAGGMMYVFAWGLVYRGFLNLSIVVWFLEMSGHSIIMVQLFGSELGVHYMFMLMPIIVFLIDFKLIYKLGLVAISIVAFILVYKYGQSVIPTGNPDDVGKTVIKLGISLIIVASGIGFVFHQSVQNAEDNYEREKKKVDEKNKNITDSIRYAKEIQEAILPTDKEIAQLLPESFVLFKPKDIVSGDFYWITQTKNNKVIWAAADCTGHGVPGAFMSMIGNALLNEIVIEKGITEPVQILNKLKSHIINSLSQTGKSGEHRDGMDIALCVLDKKTHKLEFAGANNPLYLIRKNIANLLDEQASRNVKFYENDLAEIKGDKQPIGYEEGKEEPFTNHEIQLQKGDTIYIFSDGYKDQYGGPRNKKFMAKRFRQLFIDIQEKSIQEQKEVLNKTIEDWKGDMEQIDDILVIGVRI